MRDLVCRIIDIEKLGDMSEFLNQDKENNTSVDSLGNIETLSHSIEEILAQSIDMNYLNSDYQLSMAQKEEITKTLYQKGIFNIKGSVPIVARLLKFQSLVSIGI